MTIKKTIYAYSCNPQKQLNNEVNKTQKRTSMTRYATLVQEEKSNPRFLCRFPKSYFPVLSLTCNSYTKPTIFQELIPTTTYFNCYTLS